MLSLCFFRHYRILPVINILSGGMFYVNASSFWPRRCAAAHAARRAARPGQASRERRYCDSCRKARRSPRRRLLPRQHGFNGTGRLPGRADRALHRLYFQASGLEPRRHLCRTGRFRHARGDKARADGAAHPLPGRKNPPHPDKIHQPLQQEYDRLPPPCPHPEKPGCGHSF